MKVFLENRFFEKKVTGRPPQDEISIETEKAYIDWRFEKARSHGPEAVNRSRFQARFRTIEKIHMDPSGHRPGVYIKYNIK